MASADKTEQTEAYRDIAASHIRSLSTVNARVPTILTTSATTFSQLTNAPIQPASSDPSSAAQDNPARRREALSTTANTFFTSVLELRTALHAQIDDLEKNGVIPAEDVKYRAPVQAPAAGLGPRSGQQGHQQPSPRDSEATVTNNGLGSLDVGVLNARAGARQKDGDEVMYRVKTLLEGLVKDVHGEDEDMKDG